MRLPSPLPTVLLAALLLAASSGAGCARGDGPVERYRKFAAAARGGDAETAWSCLAEQSRAALDAAAKEASAKAPPGVVPTSGRDLLLGDLAARAPRIKSAVVLRESASAAEVKIEDDVGATGVVALVREGGQWRVVLPGA